MPLRFTLAQGSSTAHDAFLPNHSPLTSSSMAQRHTLSASARREAIAFCPMMS